MTTTLGTRPDPGGGLVRGDAGREAEGGAFYNDNDPRVVAWLRSLIEAGLIAPGIVDERSIVDVHADDLVGHRRVHLFAGIGGWDFALRLAGWGDEPVWTVSCPCPPFSSAGRKKRCPECGGARPVPCPRRAGHFICLECEHAWHADARHLWPVAWKLIRDCRPPVVLGEQVASNDGRVWLAGVRASLERIGYRVGAADLAAASVGAPHIRQRLFWVADASDERVRADGHRPDGGEARADQGPGDQRQRLRADAGDDGSSCRMADPGHIGARAGHGGAWGLEEGERCQPGQHATEGRLPCRLGDAPGLGRPEHERRARPREEPDAPHASGSGRVGHTDCESRPERDGQPAGRIATSLGADSTGSGFWDAFDLIPCRDGKSRRVEPGSFPLAHGIPGRVGRLRGYGNAIVPQVAAEFIGAYLAARRISRPHAPAPRGDRGASPGPLFASVEGVTS